LAYDYHLEKGHVHTVEPGIYFIPYQLEKARTNQSWGVADFINWNVVEEWKDVGGVRIEDVVAIDWQGNSIVLTI
jgi:Xaa-Pro aminopeptidase